MDVLLLAIFLILPILLTYNHIILKYKSIDKNNGKVLPLRVPEAPGAWPFIGHLHLLHGRLPVARTLGHMADKYGPIFGLRLGSHPAIVVSSWEVVKECFTTNDLVFATRPRMAVGKYLGYNEALFALAPYGPYWRDIRKLVTVELMTISRLEKLQHVRTSEVEHCIGELHSSCHENGEVNLSEWFEHVTLNITLRLLVGKRFSRIAKHLKEVVSRALYLGGVFVPSDAIPSLEWMDIGGYIKGLKEVSKEMDEIIGTWLQEHIRNKKGDDDQSDFMDVMLSTLPEDAVISGHDRDTIIKATTLILILTGSESTAETLIWTTSLLLNNPHAIKMAQDEMDIHVGKDRLVEESDIKNLKYFQAIVKEGLRLYPPGPLSGPREAMEDCKIGKYHIPKGTRLILNLLKLHRDPRIWSEPDEFRPERWFKDEHSSIGYVGKSFEYLPFSGGRRMCPGMNFGLQVVQLTLARLLQGFNISTPMGMPVDMSEGLGIALPKLTPIQVLLTPRLPTLFPTTLKNN
nr:cytochrome P450 82C4-like [Ipomoea batatas]